MKKRLLITTALVLLVLSVATTALAFYGDMYVVTSNGKTLNLRSGPHTGVDNKIANIPYGAQVWVEQTIGGGEWCYVNYNGREGYVVSRYLSYNKPAPKPAPIPTSKPAPSHEADYRGFVGVDSYSMVRPSTPGGYVHMRWAPTKAAPVYQDYYAGASLHVIARNNIWSQVQDLETGRVGFMMSAFLVPDVGSTY